MANEDHNPRGDIVKAILVARDRAVLLDVDLALLYGVTTGALNQAVKRNLERFPSDFAFHLTSRELIELAKLAGTSEALKSRNLPRPPVAVNEDRGIMLIGPAKTPSRGIGISR